MHRALRARHKGLLSRETVDLWRERLQTLARHTSEKERRAEDAERELVQWKKVRFMANKVGDEFSGYVTGVTAFGLFVELVLSLIHISEPTRPY